MVTTEARIQELDRQKESELESTLENAFPIVERNEAVEASRPPERFKLGSLRDGRLRVVEPIGVVQMSEGRKFIVETPELNEFGFGDGFSEAIADLQAAIAELYFTLETEQERLGPELARVWSILSRKVRIADAVSRP